MTATLTPTRTTALRRHLGALAVAGALAAGLAGCSGGSDVTSSSDSGASGGGVAAEPAPAYDGDARLADVPARDEVTGVTGVTGAKGAKPADTDAAKGLPQSSFLGRNVIATAQVTVRTTDVTEAREKVGDLLRRYVGYVAEERTERNRKGDTVSSVLQLRVPTAKFDQALDDLEGLAPQVDVDRSTEDVTQQVIDVASRIRTQEVSLSRLRGFLDKATTVEGIVRLESEIARREGDLGSLRAQQRQLSDLTAESTITVHLEHVAKGKPEPKEAATGFLAGLSTGWGAFTAALVGLSQLTGVVLPFVLLVALVTVPLVLWLRRRSRTRPAPLAEPAG